MTRPTDWTESASADNATATASHAAETDHRHVLLYVVASYETASTSGLLTIKKGSDTEAEYYVHGSDVLALELRGDVNEAVSAELAASGTGGVLGKVALIGYTE